MLIVVDGSGLDQNGSMGQSIPGLLGPDTPSKRANSSCQRTKHFAQCQSLFWTCVRETQAGGNGFDPKSPREEVEQARRGDIRPCSASSSNDPQVSPNAEQRPVPESGTIPNGGYPEIPGEAKEGRLAASEGLLPTLLSRPLASPKAILSNGHTKASITDELVVHAVK